METISENFSAKSSSDSTTLSSLIETTTMETLQYENLTLLDQDIIVNVTREYPFECATIMLGYIMPFVLVITLITNTLVVMVLAQRHMRTPTNIVLFTMAVVDLITLLSPSPWYFYNYTLGYHDKYLYPPIACYAHHIMTDVIPVFFHTASIWLALLLASQRYIYVCHPTLARTWCTVPRVKKAIVFILVVAFLHQFAKFFDNIFIGVNIVDKTGRIQPACKIEIASWVGYLDVPTYYTTYFTFRILFVFIIPCVALITLNCLLFRALRRAENKRTELLRTKFKLIGDGHRCNAKSSRVTHPSSVSHFNCPNNLDIEASNKLATKISRRTWNQPKRWSQQAADKMESIESNKFLNDKVQMEYNDGKSTDVKKNKYNNEKKNKMKLLDERNAGSNEETCSLNITTLSNQIEHQKRFCHRYNYAERGSTKKGQEDEMISNCFNCAACDRNEELDCQRCSTTSNEGATVEGTRQYQCHQHHQERRQLPKTVSQCSSFLGYAANTMTNEDTSSCFITQNASSSMYVPHDETLEGIECAFKREDEESNIEKTSNQGFLTGRHLIGLGGSFFNSREQLQLAKSGSIDAHLNCECDIRKGSKSLRMTISSISQRNGCKECYLADLESESTARFLNDKEWKCVASCSNSDPYLNCNTRKELINTKSISRNMSVARNQHKKAKLLASHSDDQGNEATNLNIEANKHSTMDLFSNTGNTTVTANTATTTTTTLYSNKTNSNGSLLQVHGGNNNKQGLTAEQLGQKLHVTRFRSPSITSAGLKESKATPRGSFRNQFTSAGDSVNTATNSLVTAVSATMRTMDSNRTTSMLIVVVSVFLIVEVPVAIVTIVHVVMNSFETFKDVEVTSTLNYIKLFTNFFIIISYSVNFTIYCSMSKKFRETFRDLFMCNRWPKLNRVRGLSQQQKQQQQQQQELTQQHQNYQTHYNQHSFDTHHLAAQAPLYTNEIQNEPTTSVNGYDNNNQSGLTKFPHYNGENNEQTECEL